MAGTKKTAAPAPAPRMYSTCREALVVFTEYSAQQGGVALRTERDALWVELALFGKEVGGVAMGASCSNCLLEAADCDCKAWTCRCYPCWVMRRSYHKVQGDAYFKLVDDSSEDESFLDHLRGELQDNDEIDEHVKQQMLSV